MLKSDSKPITMTGSDMLKAKGKKLEDFDDEGSECETCWAHDTADELLEDAYLQCPSCGGPLTLEWEELSDMSVVTVGEDNACDIRDAVYRRMKIGHCPKCENTYGLYAIPIQYNGNHDIYYTGGGSYVPGADLYKRIRESIHSKIKEFIDRTKKGESIRDLDLSIAYAIEGIVAAELKKNRLKL